MLATCNSKTAFLESDVLVLFTTTSLMMPQKLLLFLSCSHASTIATFSWLVSLGPWSANFRVQNCAARLVVRARPHVHVTPILRHLHWLPVTARISYKIACLCFNAIISSTPAFLSDLISSLQCRHPPARNFTLYVQDER